MKYNNLGKNLHITCTEKYHRLSSPPEIHDQRSDNKQNNRGSAREKVSYSIFIANVFQKLCDKWIVDIYNFYRK